MEEGSVKWEAWGPEAFDRARREGKLVFLDISATWCHWCHVLDRTSLSDPRVIALLDEAYVPVRVDTDRRPDVNDRYNQGGWPTTAVLLPDGQLLTGATYLPPDALFEVLRKCAEFYGRERERVEAYMREEARESLPAQGPEPSAPPGPRPEDIALVKHAVLAQYDPAHPGFFREPKFLVPEILAFLRDGWILEGNAEMGETFLRVLRRMAGSGVHDAVEGGFFRYATRRDWTVPHYEKLLADNAEMLALYASAFAKTGDELCARTAEGILRFLFGVLHDPATGAFHASRDADEEYYLLSAHGRAGRAAPAVDRTLISEYNARAVSALAAAHRAFGAGGVEGTDSLLDRAVRLGRFLRDRLWRPDEGQLRFEEDGAAEAGHLADNASAAMAYLDLWEATGRREWLDAAGEVLEWTVNRLFSAKAPGFLDRRPRDRETGALGATLIPFAANAVAARALILHSREAGRTDLFAIAEQALRGLSAEFERRSAFGAPYGSALLLYWKGSAGSACIPGDPACPSPPGAAAGVAPAT